MKNEKKQVGKNTVYSEDLIRQLQERAAKDPLTGLLNRGEAESHINEILKKLEPQDKCALFIIDLDNFKNVNDTLGHQVGDQVLRKAARILSGIFRFGDFGDIVGRLGGDEFVVFMHGTITEALVRKKGQEICAQLQFILGTEQEITVSASAGILFCPSRDYCFDDFYHSADMALYEAKRSGRHRYCLNTEISDGDEARDDILPANAVNLNLLLKTMDNGVALVEFGEIKKIIYANSSFAKLIGSSQKSLWNVPAWDFVHPDDRIVLDEVAASSGPDGLRINQVCRIGSERLGWRWCRMKATRIEYNSEYPVVFITLNDISEFKEMELRLREQNEWLQMFFEQTSQDIWDVDLATGMFGLYQGSTVPGHLDVSKTAFPEEVIATGWVAPDSADNFRRFAKELYNGKVKGYGNFIIRYRSTGCYGWASLSYRMLFDEDGRAVRALGIIQFLGQDHFSEKNLDVMQNIPDVNTQFLIMRFSANLTKNEAVEVWIEGRSVLAAPIKRSYDNIFHREMEKVFSKEARKDLEDHFSRDALIKAYDEGRCWLRTEYRRIDNSGKVGWITAIMHLYKDMLTEDIYSSVFLLHSDFINKSENLLKITPEYEPVSKFHTRESIANIASRLMAHAPSMNCALAVLSIGGLESLIESGEADQVRCLEALSSAMVLAFGVNCVRGCLERDRLVLFFTSVTTQEGLQMTIERGFSYLRNVLAEDINVSCLRFVAGVVNRYAAEATYDDMLLEAENICALRKNSASDVVAFSSGKSDMSWKDVQIKDRADQIFVHHKEMDRPLSEREKDVQLRCLKGMLTADSLETSVYNLLGIIGSYYRADRVYILSLAGNGHVVAMTYEWLAAGKRSIQQAVTGLFIERFPLLKRCMNEKAPISLNRSKSAEAQSDTEKNVWNFMILPIFEEQGLNSFLCIENAGEYQEDVALAGTLTEFLVTEKKRFLKAGKGEPESKSLVPVDLPNLKAYKELIHKFDLGAYGSMGVVCVDIPKLSEINSREGFEYGRRMLWYISTTMTGIFGRDFVFRTWDSEFIALCPDIIQQVFLGRCTRLRIAIGRRYPREVRIGHTWADGVFDSRELAEEAKAIMQCTAPEVISSAVRKNPLLGGYSSVGEAISDGRFTVHLQPKFHMGSCELIGAEVFARGIDKDGTLVSPHAFLSDLEERHCIRELDFYVLSRAYGILDKWRTMGLPLVPLSVNFSEYTLLDSSAFASVLAIMSRYPDVDAGMVEIEVMQNGRFISQHKLAEIVGQFKEEGVPFALDNFGSKNTNISAFTNVNFDTVKLDRSLVGGIIENDMNFMFIENIIRMCESSGMRCIAAGVETKDQMEALIQAGCKYGQGHYYDRPMPPNVFRRKYLQSGSDLHFDVNVQGGIKKG